MVLDLNTVLFATSLLAMFFYQFSSFSYASGLLVGSSTNKLVFVALSFVNTSIFGVAQFINIPFHFVIPSFLLILTLEFKLISKTDFVQVFCGAAIFTLHLSAFTTPLIVIFSTVLKIPPTELIDNTVYDSIIVIITCITLSLAHELVKKYIDNTSIQRVTVKSKHSVILLVSIILILILQVDHIAAVVTHSLYDGQVLLSVTVSLASLLIFYLFFIYSMNLIDASLYKRFSDQVLNDQRKINAQKENLMAKIERDELTGVFNRRYIMSALESLCNDEENENSFYVLFVDINALKHTNDVYGHSAGDRLITKIAHAILSSVRENDIVARIGGDEFLIILTDLQDDDCTNIVDRIKQNIETQNRTEEFLVSASIGSIFVDEYAKKQGASYIFTVSDENMRKNKELFYKAMKEGSV